MASTFYVCDFKNSEEKIENDDGIILFSGHLGTFVCDLLSLDFEELAHSLASVLNENAEAGRAFPITEVQKILEESFKLIGFKDLKVLIRIVENIYKSTAKSMFISEYGSLKNSYFIEIFERFKRMIILQAYLDESGYTPDMCFPRNFERFINGGLEKRIMKQELAISTSEYDLPSDVVPGKNIRHIVKDVYSNLTNFSDDFIVLDATDLSDLLIAIVYYFFSNNLQFKRCGNCGRFFIPISRSDEIYCNNPSPQDKSRTCKQYGTERLWYDRLKGDEAAKLSRNIYMAKQMLVKRNPDISAYKEMFEYFKAERKKWEKAVKDGEKTREEYINWLNIMKKKKTL